MSNRRGVAWTSWLHDTRLQFQKLGYPLPPACCTHGAFRDDLEGLCTRHNVKRIPQVNTSFFASCKDVVSLARDVDAGAGTAEDSDGVVGLVWGALMVALQKCCPQDDLSRLIQFVESVNKRVPKFTRTPSRFVKDLTIQEPLQVFFTEYLQTYALMIQLSSRSDGILKFTEDPKLQAHVEELVRKTQEAKGRHDGLVRAAEDDEQRRIQNQASSARRNFDGEDDVSQPTFRKIKSLGRTSLSEVDKVEETSTGDLFARKRIYWPMDSASTAQARSDMQDEIKIMRKLHHEHITSFVLSWMIRGGYCFTMTPVADCNLQRYLDDCIEKGFPENETSLMQRWFGSLLDALSYAHSKHIKHNDIKPSNVLVHDGRPILCDFSLAKDFTDQLSTSDGLALTGTPLYYPPEKERGRAADLYALGCVFSEMLTVINKKSLQDYKETRRAKHGSTVFRDSLPTVHQWVLEFKQDDDRLQKRLVSFVRNMLDEDPDMRDTAEDLVKKLTQGQGRERFFC